MKLLLQHFFSTVLVAFACQVYAQEAASDTTAISINTGLSIYVDYGKLLTIATDFETKLEGGVAWRFKNMFSPNVQVGISKVSPSGAIDNGSYTAEGQYTRIGVDYLIPIDALHLLYAGVKYGVSQFEEKGSYEIASDLWSNYSNGFSRSDLQASWFEAIVGTEANLNESWSAGGYLSLRILSDRKEFAPIDTYAIPGYGRAFDNTIPAVNVYIRFNL